MTDLKDMSIEELRDYNQSMGSLDGLKTMYLTVPVDSFDELVRRYRELEANLTAKDAECRLKVIEALEDARETIESDTHPRRAISAMIEKRKGGQT